MKKNISLPNDVAEKLGTISATENVPWQTILRRLLGLQEIEVPKRSPRVSKFHIDDMTAGEVRAYQRNNYSSFMIKRNIISAHNNGRLFVVRKTSKDLYVTCLR